MSVPFLALECWGAMVQAHMCARTQGLHEQVLMWPTLASAHTQPAHTHVPHGTRSCIHTTFAEL